MSDSHRSWTDSEEDDEFITHKSDLPSLRGVLLKWTNYLNGWQDRYVTCGDGTLSYYRAENETEFGCRGSMSLAKAAISCHEFDKCRFDVSINDSVWYIRVPDETSRQQWIETIEANKKSESGYESDGSNLRRDGSVISLGSESVTSFSFCKGRGLYEKLAELETFRDILCRQVDTLQKHFDACSLHPDIRDNFGVDVDADDEIDHDDDDILLLGMTAKKHARTQSFQSEKIDFKGEAITFKATTAGVIATLSHCIDLMTNREDTWQRRLEKEHKKRRRLEEQLHHAVESSKSEITVVGNPDDFEDESDTTIEELFVDAVEKQEEVIDDMKLLPQSIVIEKEPPDHPFVAELEQRIQGHLTDSIKDPSRDEHTNWELFAEEGELKIYSLRSIEEAGPALQLREIEGDGASCDPLKAIHAVEGVTAREMCHYFWTTDDRMDWEETIENIKVVDAPNDHTSIVHQTHKKVWPTSQRDCLYLSSLKKVDDLLPEEEKIRDPKPDDTFIVCNFSVDHPENEPLPGCLRATASIALICQTFITPPQNGGPIDRSCLKCKFIYVANINLGGWAPSSVMRAVYKREYPKFLRRFTQFVKDKTKDQAILF